MNNFNNISAGKRVYPFYTDAFGIKGLESKVIPESVYEDIKQAELSYFAGAFYGAGLLLRSACQNICRDKKACGRSLYEEIDDLKAKSLITKSMAEMAHAIRIIGNEIAHPNPNTVFVVTRDDVRQCQEFIKQLIHVLYIDPDKLKKFKENIKERGL